MIKILLVDDDPDYLFQMKFALEKLGYHVDTEESRKDAEQYMRENKPDIAIIDLMMEEDDSGFILSYRIKQLHPELPIIILTAVVQETGRRFIQGNDHGGEWVKADLFLEKGIHPDQLDDHITRLIKQI